MLRPILRIVVYLFVACAGLSAAAQPDLRPAEIDVFDKNDRTILIGATVTIRSGQDTIRGVTEKVQTPYTVFSLFRCERIFTDSVLLRITYVGYKPYEKRFSATEFNSSHSIGMEPDDIRLSRIVVTGDQIAMIIKGDTTVYHAGAFKTMEGDRFESLIRQLPGVEIRNSKIYANGEQIKRVYVDGRNLFGANTSYALSDLTAEEVKKVEVYEERNPVAARLDDRTAPKEKVMNVETRSKRKVIRGGSAALTGGVSLAEDPTGRREFRHAEELTLYRNSVNGSVRLNAANSRNDGVKERASAAAKILPSEKTAADLFHEYRSGDSTSVSTYVYYSRQKERKRESRFTDYFPTDAYTERTIDNATDALQRMWSVNAGNNLTLMRRKHIFNSSLDLNLSRNRSQTDERTEQRIDREQSRSDRHERQQLRERKAMLFLNYHTVLSKRTSLHLSLSGDYAHRTDQGWSIDTTATTPGMRTLEQSDRNDKTILGALSGELQVRVGEHGALRASCLINRTYDKQRRRTVDFLTDPAGIPDATNSYDYTINTLLYTFQAGWHYNREHFNCAIKLGGLLYDARLDERLPQRNEYPHSWFLFTPSVTFAWGKPRDRFRFNLGSYAGSLSVEMLRNTLDASNPMFLRAGNPRLRPSNSYTARFEYDRTDDTRARTLRFGLTGGYVFNDIVTERRLFLKDEYLPQYDYTAVAGAQLTTQTNRNGNLRAGASVAFSQRIARLKSTVRASLAYDFRRRPYYVDDALSQSDDHTGTLILGINTGFSSHIRIDLASKSSLGRYAVGDKHSGYFRETLTGNVELRIAKKYFVTGTALYDFYRNATLLEANRSNLIANAAAGRKFGKSNALALSIGVVDLFDNTDYLATTLANDYLSTTTSSFLGRYAYLNATWTF